MQTKSTIQLIRESFAVANEYKVSLENLMEKYNIEDSVFTYNGKQTFEVTSGYFAEVKEYDNLADAIRECMYATQPMGIRIQNNKTFTAGYITNTLAACPKDVAVMDINTLTSVR